jgi:hypothetical protein
MPSATSSPATYNAKWLIEKNGYLSPSTPARRISTPTSGAPHRAIACPEIRVRYTLTAPPCLEGVIG